MRYKVFKELFQDTTNNITFYDPTSIKWKDFPWNNGFMIHQITKQEIEKPYLISYKYYKTVDYEDIILLLNDISNIWQVVPGKKIKIPTLENLTSFLLQIKQ